MPEGLFELSVIIALATVLGVFARLLKQPVILAYLATGAIIGYYGIFNINDQEMFHIFSKLGIMFLLFLVGLEINYSSIRQVGKTSIIVGLGQIIFTFVFGYFIAQAIGFATVSSMYIGIALTFSSTIIIVKLLSEKKDLHSLYGKISIGFMLVQDFMAILLLVLLAGVGTDSGFNITTLAFTVGKGVLLIAVLLWLGRKILPYIFDTVARSHELLFLMSLTWVMVLAAVVTKLGFSVEIGGFLAGLALANSSENFEIASRIKSLRDFFILLFFVILGSSLVIYDFSGLTVPIIILSLFVLIGNPLIVLTIMGIMGYRHRTSFLAGVTVAQISEFSLILAALGLQSGHIEESTVALITAVGVITITLSTYMIIYGEHIARKLKRFLLLFERKNLIEEAIPDERFSKPVILVGANRTGESIAYHLPKKELLIIDFDPDVVVKFRKNKFTVLFGDISDEEIFEKANFENAKIIISTSPDFEDNCELLKRMKKNDDKNKKVIVRADTEVESRLLYEKGASYVIFPNLTSGHYLGKQIGQHLDIAFLTEQKKRDIRVIRRRENGRYEKK